MTDFSSMELIGFVATGTWLIYSFYKSWMSDPGKVYQDQDQRYRVS